jgi:hypothetical protein
LDQLPDSLKEVELFLGHILLHTTRQGKYHFQLGDFSLSNRQNIATTHSDMPLYMAPEIF